MQIAHRQRIQGLFSSYVIILVGSFVKSFVFFYGSLLLFAEHFRGYPVKGDFPLVLNVLQAVSACSAGVLSERNARYIASMQCRFPSTVWVSVLRACPWSELRCSISPSLIYYCCICLLFFLVKLVYVSTNKVVGCLKFTTSLIVTILLWRVSSEWLACFLQGVLK